MVALRRDHSHLGASYLGDNTVSYLDDDFLVNELYSYLDDGIIDGEVLLVGPAGVEDSLQDLVELVHALEVLLFGVESSIWFVELLAAHIRSGHHSQVQFVR